MARPDTPASVYLDSNTLISVIIQRAGYEPVADVLRLADAGKVALYISALSYVEVRGWGLDQPYPAELDARGLTLLDSPTFLRVEFHRRVAVAARRLAHHHGLKNYDAIHLASAVEAGAEVLMTTDARFPVGQLVEGVWVDEPYTLGGQDPLFT